MCSFVQTREKKNSIQSGNSEENVGVLSFLSEKCNLFLWSFCSSTTKIASSIKLFHCKNRILVFRPSPTKSWRPYGVTIASSLSWRNPTPPRPHHQPRSRGGHMDSPLHGQISWRTPTPPPTTSHEVGAALWSHVCVVVVDNLHAFTSKLCTRT